MTQKEFVNKYLPFAKETEKKTGISAIAILAQGALESGWGSVAPGNMIFGIKDTDGVNGNEQLLTTTEYSRSATAKFPRIQKVTPVLKNGQKWFNYMIKDYFRKYDTPEGSFTDHAKFFLTNSRYAEALKVKADPYKFIDAIAKAGYATAPDYATILKGIAKTIEKLTK
ncbi:MAG: glucosaminidase domain-containing protein [Bacteroidota bacterium]